MASAHSSSVVAIRGTAVKKSSQIKSVGATTLPERVSAAMSEIAENM